MPILTVCLAHNRIVTEEGAIGQIALSKYVSQSR
jgi:hypothetical protein